MYDNYDNGQDGTAVAELMRYCGQSVEMNYGSSSGAQSNKVATALKTYFDYDNTVTNIDRDQYTADEWSEIIYTELKEGRPVVYGGGSSDSGHEFVIDGYSEDELFHFNWGWGGSCNGYFLLAVANPYNNTGAGASGSTDGYSLRQDATIGIQPQQGTAAPVLLLTAVGLEANDLSTTRTSSSDNFSVSMNLGTRNYTGEQANFDIGVGVFDNDDNLLSAYTRLSNYQLSAGGYGWSALSSTVTFGADLQDGDYQLKNISRPAGTETWYKSHHADNYVVYATISGNTLTLLNQSVSLTGSGITAEGTMENGSIINLNTNITNNGTFFNGYLYLFVDGSLAGGKMFEAQGGQTKLFTIEYIPTSTGTISLKICTDKAGANSIATAEITVVEPESGVPTDNVELTFAQEIINAEGTNVLGKTAQVKIIITNSTSSNYSGIMCLLTWKWTGGSGSANGPYSEITIPANSTVELIKTSRELTGADKYSFTISYYKNGGEVEDRSKIYDFYTPVDAYAIYDAAGNSTMKKAVASITTDATTAFVDLRGQTTVQSVASQANPNTIFLLDESASLTGATNIVKGSTAESISLTDGNDFYTPIAFTANSISYSRTPNQGFSSGSGWATITLPFDVETVTANGEEIDWFHSSTDKGKNFWVMEFSGDNGSTVNFDFANEMKAYTPYIFTVPGDNYGEKWNLKGKTLVFTGSNANIKASNDASATITGSSFKFVGTTSAKSNLTDIYKLNDEGSTFQKGNASVESFRAYFAPTTYQYATDMLNIGIGGGTTTGIADMLPAQKKAEKDGIYHLNGMKAGNSLESLPAGIYIINGKKVVK